MNSKADYVLPLWYRLPRTFDKGTMQLRSKLVENRNKDKP